METSNTNQQLNAVILGLMETISDQDSNVREAVTNSLIQLGITQPHCVLSAIHAFMAKHVKLQHAHRGALLDVMKEIINVSCSELPTEFLALIINLATQEMTMQKESSDIWQTAASNLLVTLARKNYCADVMDALLQKFQPGFVPHIFVVDTLGAVAIANVFDFLPFLSDIFGRMVPLLPSVKNERTKQSFATAICRFCESIREYLGNVDRAPDPSVRKEVYSAHVGMAYEILFSSWVQSRDQKVKNSVLECLGDMCHVLTTERLNDECRRLIPVYLYSFKKSSADFLSIGLGLCRALEALIQSESCPLEPLLEDLWTVLFHQMLNESDGTNSAMLDKHYAELLRCFHVTAVRYADRLVYFLLQKLQSTHEKSKVSSLKIIRHLVNSCGPYMDDKKGLIVVGLKPVLNDTSYLVKTQLCQLSVALADHGYLLSDGGQLLVEFLIKQLCYSHSLDVSAGTPVLSHRKTEADTTVKHLCSNALHVLTASVRQAEQVLWPYLFEFMCVEQFTPALPDLYRSLAVLSSRMNEENRLALDLNSKNERMPGKHQVLSRLLVTIGVPEPGGRGKFALELLQQLAHLFDAKLPVIWQDLLVPLRSILEDTGQNALKLVEDGRINESKWEKMVLKFVSRSVSAVDNEDWARNLAAAMGKQFQIYSNQLEERKFLLKCLGGLLMKINNRQFVLDHIELMFRSIKHSSSVEREGCAIGIGYCATVHTDLVLTKLQNEAKLEFQRKSTGFLGFIKDSMPGSRSDGGDFLHNRATLMLSYGYVTLFCPVTQLSEKLDSVISRIIMQGIDSAKEQVVQESILRALGLIYYTVYENSIREGYFTERKSQFLNFVLDCMKSEPANSIPTAVRACAMQTAANIVKLDPPLSDGDLSLLLSTSLIYSFSPLPTTFSMQDAGGDASSDALSNSAVSVLKSLHNLLEEIIKKQPNIPCLNTVAKSLVAWLNHERLSVREATVDAMLVVLKTYYSMVPVALGHATEFNLLGSLLGRLCTRICDHSAHLREQALTSVHWLLAIAVLHMGRGKDYSDPTIENILEFKDSVLSTSYDKQIIVVEAIAKIANQRLASKQLQLYLSVLFDQLGDDRLYEISGAAARLLKFALAERGVNLGPESDTVVTTLLNKLPSLSNMVDCYAEILQSVFVFSEHHFLTIMNVLLSQQLPYSECICDTWHKLARDKTMFTQMLEYLLDMLATESITEQLEGSSNIYACVKPQMALAALVEILKAGEPINVLLKLFPRLLMQITFTGGALLNSVLPTRHTRIALDWSKNNKSLTLVQSSLKYLLLRLNFSDVLETIDSRSGWHDLIDDNHFADGISTISRAMVANTTLSAFIEDLLNPIESHLTGRVTGHRIVSAAMLSEFVRYLAENDEMAETMISLLMSGLADECLLVRKLSVRGMGNLAHCNNSIIEKYVSAILAAIMAGLEDSGDHKDEVAFEAMSAMSKMIGLLHLEHVENVLVSILLRIKPCFEKESSAIRTVAYTLFGHLAKFAGSDSFVEQIQNSLISMLIHANDEVIEVRKAVAFCMQELFPLLQCDEVTNALVNGLNAQMSEVSKYQMFLRLISAALVLNYQDMMNFFTLSAMKYYAIGVTSVHIRVNAIHLTRELLHAMPTDVRNDLSKDQIFFGLVSLLKDTNASIRAAAAEACQFVDGNDLH